MQGHRWLDSHVESPWLQGGKLDLTEVEGIADLLAAETEAQHQQVSLPP